MRSRSSCHMALRSWPSYRVVLWSVVVVVLCVVSEALSLCCMVSWSRLSCCMRYDRCCRAVCCCSCGHGHCTECCRGRRHRSTCGVAVTVVAPCDVAVVVAVIKPRGATATVIVLTSSWPRRRHMSLLSYHCRGQWLGHGRPWRGRMAARPSARRVVRAR